MIYIYIYISFMYMIYVYRVNVIGIFFIYLFLFCTYYIYLKRNEHRREGMGSVMVAIGCSGRAKHWTGLGGPPGWSFPIYMYIIVHFSTQ